MHIDADKLRVELAAACTHQLALRYDRIVLHIEATHEPVLQWLTEFLNPSFAQIPCSADPDVHIRFVAHKEIHDLLKAQGPTARPSKVSTFALDTALDQADVWHTTPQETVVRDSTKYVFYLVDSSRRDLSILASAPHVDARVTLMRVVREVTSSLCGVRGGHCIHAAGFCVGNQGILLGGAKKAGKTTLLLHALTHARVKYVANDRLFVFGGSGQPYWMHGMPTIVSIRNPSLAYLPSLQSRVDQGKFDHTKALRELEPETACYQPNHLAQTMSPIQLCTWLQTTGKDHVPLGALVFPQITKTKGGMELRPLAKQEALAMISSVMFRSESDIKTGDLFTCSPQDRTRGLDPMPPFYADVADQLPCYICMLGTEAYRPGVFQEQFLGPLLDQG